MKTWLIAAVAASTAVLPAAALATPITFTTQSAAKAAAKPVKTSSGSQGKAVAGDVTLGGISASQLVYSGGVNPQQGPNGNSSGFAAAFAASGADDWASLAKFAANPAPANGKVDGLALIMAFALTDMRHGTWSITNLDTGNNLSFDLAFAMHTGGGSGSWLFDNYLLQAGSTAQGAWSLNLFNPGGKLSDYSNLTLFVRNAAAAPVALTPVAAPVANPVSAPVVGPLAPAQPVADPVAANPAASDPIVKVPVADILPVADIPVTNIPAPGDYVFNIPLAELIAAIQQNHGAANGNGLAAGGFEPVGDAADHGGSEIPEPGSIALFLAGAGTFALTRRRRHALPTRPSAT